MNRRNVLAMFVFGYFVCLCGCQQECVTKKDDFSFPIIVSSHSDRVCHDNGTLDVRANGRACLLAHWNNNRTYDANGELIRYDDQSGIWPFYKVIASKNENRERSSGTILLFFQFENEKHL